MKKKKVKGFKANWKRDPKKMKEYYQMMYKGEQDNDLERLEKYEKYSLNTLNANDTINLKDKYDIFVPKHARLRNITFKTISESDTDWNYFGETIVINISK